MENELLISIIVPVYNIESELERCVGSILSQTYQNLEVILVDDGSADGSLAVMNRLAGTDRRIIVLHKENGGVTSARLTGVRAAHGEWIGFVDGDDEVEPEMFHRLLDNAVNYHADISHCGYQMVFPDRIDYYYNTGRLEQQDCKMAVKNLLAGTFEPTLCSKLFCRRLFQPMLNTTAMDPTIRFNEDLLMNYYLFREAEMTIFEDICPYHYLIRSESATKSVIDEHQLCDSIKVRRILVGETKADPELNGLCLQNLTYQLIRASTRAAGKQPLIEQHKKELRLELRDSLPTVLRSPYCGKKTKLMALWAAVWPASYQLVHTVYGEITGVNHKYDIQ